ISSTYSSVLPHGGSGMSLNVKFSLPKAGNYGGSVIPLGLPKVTRDISRYRTLEFYVRGSENNLSFKVELHNASADPARRSSRVYLSDYLDGGITTDWQKVQIPLAAFANLD